MAKLDPKTTRRHFQHAYERDLPLHWTICSEPLLIGRRSIRYVDVFAYLLSQQQARQLQRSTSQKGDGHSSSRESAVDDVSQSDALQSLLTTAGGGAMHRHVKAQHHFDQDAESNDIGARLGSDTVLETEQSQERVLRKLLANRIQASNGTEAGVVDAGISVDDSYFYGVRQVPPDSHEYATTLHALAMQPVATEEDDSAFAVEKVPDFVRSLLLNVTVGSCDENGDTIRDGAYSPDERGSQSSTVAGRDLVPGAARWQLQSYPYNPLVVEKRDTVMDALVPPRLLVYFEVDPDALADEYMCRNKRKRRVEQLRYEDTQHRGNKHVEEELEAERTALLSSGPIVGQALFMMERASTAPVTRNDLLTLERTVETWLHKSRSRCWGVPLKMHPQSSSYQKRESQSHGEPLANVTAKALTATTKIIPRPPPKRASPTTEAVTSSGRNANADGGMKMAQAAAPSNSDRPGGDGGFFSHTTRQGVGPSVLSAERGGTATVISTLNILELNRERTNLLFFLLAEELVRQVALDLPERAILLRRVLNEAELSMRSYEELLQTSVRSTADHLLDGQEDREASAARLDIHAEEIAALKKKKEELEAKKRALQAYTAERVAAGKREEAANTAFQDMLLERLRVHTDEVKAMQDRERRGSLGPTTA